MAQKSLRRLTQWMVAMSCRRSSLPGPACAWTPHGFYMWGFPSPLGSCRREVRVEHQTAFRDSTPDFSSRLSPEVFFTSGYFCKTAEALNQSFPSPMWAAKGHRATPARMPVIPLATRSHHVVFAYDQVVRPHRSYRPSGGLPRGKPHVDLPAIVRSQRRGHQRRQGKTDYKSINSCIFAVVYLQRKTLEK